MNRITFPILTLAFSLAPVLCWAAEPKPKASDNDAAQLKALQDEQVSDLTRLVDALAVRNKGGSFDVAGLCSAENDLCNALFDSTDDPDKRIAVLAKQLETANDLLKLTQVRFNEGLVTYVDLGRAKSLYLGLKIKLLRERGRKRPPMPAPTGK